MQQGRPSRTALRVAMRRATHQLFDHPQVFTDPIAIPILGPDAEEKLRQEPEEERESPGSRIMRAFVTARSRFAEDELALSVRQGVRQYVVLGAGLDTFACRNPFPGLTVFEVDYPATQEWKRRQLQASGIALPPSLRYAPVDFEHQTLAEGLAAAGFRVHEPAFFSWLGVIMYLTRPAALATLAYIGSLPPGSAVAFDYSIPRELLPAQQQAGFDALSARVAAAGEPFRLFFAPQELHDELRRAGFSQVEDLDSDAINARYFDGRSDGLRLYGKGAHLLCARAAAESGPPQVPEMNENT